jgi:hypothetical protein
LDEVLAFLEERRFPLHPAYTRWLLTRVSCAFCIMSSLADLRAAARCPENHDLYRRMVRLEVASTFAFHGDLWLGDVAPELLSTADLAALIRSKSKAQARRELESGIPRDLLYSDGWPLAVPTRAAAELLCDVRQQVGQLIDIDVGYTNPAELIQRYEELWSHKHERAA